MEYRGETNKALRVSGEMPKKVFGGFDNVFHVYLMKGFQKYERN